MPNLWKKVQFVSSLIFIIALQIAKPEIRRYETFLLKLCFWYQAQNILMAYLYQMGNWAFVKSIIWIAFLLPHQQKLFQWNGHPGEFNFKRNSKISFLTQGCAISGLTFFIPLILALSLPLSPSLLSSLLSLSFLHPTFQFDPSFAYNAPFQFIRGIFI